jgi:hypothetical protein
MARLCLQLLSCTRPDHITQAITYNSFFTDYKAVSFLSCPSAQHVYRADSIQQSEHPITATVLGDAIKGTLCRT